MNILKKLEAFSFNQNKEFLSNLLRLALPMIVQSMTMALLHMIDVVMVGQLGEVAIAAVGVSGQAVFLMTMFFMGVNTGTASLMSQHWGAQNVPAVRQLLGVSLRITFCAALVFFVIGRFFPRNFMEIYSNDAAVIEAGVQYMSIVAFSYLFVAIAQTFATCHRATESVKLPMTTGIIAVCTNTVLNFLLIGGNFGFPALGIRGAAIATVIACSLEAIVILSVTYCRKMTPAAKISELIIPFRKKLIHWRTYLIVVAPVIAGELFWALGEAQFKFVYSRMGTDVMAGVGISTSIERLVVVVIGGIAMSTAVMLGKLIGEGNREKATVYMKKCMIFTGMVSICLLTILFFLRGTILSIFNVSPDVRMIAFNLLGVYYFIGFLRHLNFTSIAGVLRGGGDTRFAMYIDTIPLWIFGVPLAYIFGLVVGWPPHWIYMLFGIEQSIKLVLGIIRMKKGKWIHDLASSGV